MMKVIISVLISFIAAVACCLAMQCNAVKASAYYELSVIAAELGENQGNYVEADDFRIDFCIEENLGIAAFGTGFYYDSQHYSPVLDANGGAISAADFEEDVPFYEYDGVVCIGVVDVDNAGDIDAADGQEILRYHVVTEVMSGTYTGNVGTTGYLYTTVTVPITNDN